MFDGLVILFVNIDVSPSCFAEFSFCGLVRYGQGVTQLRTARSDCVNSGHCTVSANRGTAPPEIAGDRSGDCSV